MLAQTAGVVHRPARALAPVPNGLVPIGLVLIGLAALTGCGGEPDRAPAVNRDPVVAAALADPLMTDPDLVEQNQRNQLLDFAAADAAPIPPIERSDEALAAARAEAGQLLGASPPKAPDPVIAPAGESRDTAQLTARAALAALGLPRDCAARIGYGFGWAARVPAAIPIYPRGHAQEAAGTDGPPCRMRVVQYLTPVPAAELVDFYWARARSAGFAPEHRREGQDEVVRGRRGSTGFVAWVAARDGLSVVDLVTSE